MSAVVSDASPLIALQQIGQLGLLGTIFGTVLVPPAVAREALSVERPSWVLERALGTSLPPAVTRAGLGVGESEERRSLIPAIRDPIDILRRGGFRVADDLYESMLQKAGEIP